MELHPRVPLFRVGRHGPGHALGMRAHRPRRHGHPGAVLLAEELVHRHPRGFAHEVVHRRSQTEGGLVAYPVEGVRADVLVQHLLPFRSPAFAEADEPVVGADDVYRALRQVVVVEELVRPWPRRREA